MTEAKRVTRVAKRVLKLDGRRRLRENIIKLLEKVKRVRQRETVKQVSVMDDYKNILTEKNEVYQSWLYYFEGYITVKKERGAEITTSPGMTATVFEKTDQNNTKYEVGKVSKRLKTEITDGLDAVAMVQCMVQKHCETL